MKKLLYFYPLTKEEDWEKKVIWPSMKLGKDASSITMFGITTNNIGHFVKEHAKNVSNFKQWLVLRVELNFKKGTIQGALQ